MSEYNKLVKLINDSEEDYQLIEISRYVERKYQGDKLELRRNVVTEGVIAVDTGIEAGDN